MRAVPLAVLLAVVAMALAVRFRASPSKISLSPSPVVGGIAAGAQTRTPSAPSKPQLTALGGPLVDPTARVTEHSPRMLHGDPRHTGRARGRLPSAPTLAWTYATSGPIEAQITLSPDERTLYVASLDGTLTALTRNGAKLWAVSLGDRIYSTPCVADDGTVYVGSDAKQFVAIAPDGVVKWKLDTPGDADTSAAILANGNVVFAAGAMVIAVRPGGDVAWRFSAKKKVFASPAITPDPLNPRVIFGSQDDHVYALDADGGPVWSVDLGADVDGAPAIADDGTIYVGTDAGEIVKLEPDGHVVWRAPMGGYVRGTLAITRSGDLLAGVYGPLPRQVRVSAVSGEIRGAQAIVGTSAKDFGVHGGALEDEAGALAFGAQDDTLYVIDRTGIPRWQFRAGGDIDAPLTLTADGSLVAASDDGKVYCFSPR